MAVKRESFQVVNLPWQRGHSGRTSSPILGCVPWQWRSPCARASTSGGRDHHAKASQRRGVSPRAPVIRDEFAPVRARCDNGSMWWLAHGEHDVPASDVWLSSREQAMLATLRYTKRRVEFLTRRWTAKRAVAKVLDRDRTPSALAAIEIRHHVSGAPYLEVEGRLAAIEVSLSDRAGWAVCLVGPPGGWARPARHRPRTRGATQ